MRVLDIVGEMLAGVRQTKSELNDKLADLYWFLFRRVSEAKINSDAAALAEVLQLLEFERQTWQKVCEKLQCDTAARAPRRVPPRRRTSLERRLVSAPPTTRHLARRRRWAVRG